MSSYYVTVRKIVTKLIVIACGNRGSFLVVSSKRISRICGGVGNKKAVGDIVHDLCRAGKKCARGRSRTSIVIENEKVIEVSIRLLVDMLRREACRDPVALPAYILARLLC